MVDKNRKMIYKAENITLNDILEFAFRSAGTQRMEMVKKAVKVINDMIKHKGILSLDEFAKIAGYDYSNPQQKFWFKNNFFTPLFNAGLIKELYNEEIGEITHISLDNQFGKLMQNFKEKWEHLAYRYVSENGGAV